jgi:ribosome-binding factor A
MERIQRVNQLIKKELSQIILRELDFPKGVLVTVTRVETSKNLIQTRVYISVLPEEKGPEILETMNQKIYSIQQLLNKRLKMRPLPKIVFVEEKETAQAGKIEQLLKEIKKDD